MKPIPLLLLLFVFALACSEADKAKPVSEAGEKVYPIRGVLQSRDAAENSLRIDHEAIPEFMPAMVMDYYVRGVKVAALPPDKTRIEGKLHVTEHSYWITDVKRVP
jgi:Cu/Ag efflux protein CusF